MIPWASPLAQYRSHAANILAAMTRVCESGNYILGVEVDAFERAFAAYCGVTHAVGVGSGTDSLSLALKAIGVGEGDEVITVSHTAVATVAAVLSAGAKPVLVDIDPVYYTLDPSKLEAVITSRSKAIIVVHLYGQVADMETITAIARRHNLKIIEDCAQAAGARYRGRRVGTIGDIGCFSFYPTKNLGAIGDGGMVVTDDAALADNVRRLRQYGWDENRQCKGIGVNSRLDPLQAAILGVKLPHLDADNARRVSIARRYSESFAKLPLRIPVVRDGADHAYHLYVVAASARDALMAALAHQGIGSAVHYPSPVHLQAGYAEYAAVSPDGLPVTTQLVSQILSLPMYPELEDGQVTRIIGAVCDFFQRTSVLKRVART